MLKRIQKRVDRKEREVQSVKGKKSAAEAENQASGSDQGEDSGSEVGQGDSEDGEEEDEDDRSELMSMSGEEDSDDDDDDDDDDDEEEDGDEEDDDDISEDDEDAPPVSLDDALSKPIYSLQASSSDGSDQEGEKGEASSEPKRKLQACILCPQKLFKNEKMAEDHLKSKSHIRSRVRFAQRLLDPDNLTSDDPRDIVLDILEDLASKKTAKAAEDEDEEKKEENTIEGKKADQGKKRKWKEEAKVAKEARREAKRSKSDGREPRAEVELKKAASSGTTSIETGSITKPIGKMNREARRIEQLLESLGEEKRAAFEPTLKGKKGKDKVKAILEEKKRVEGSKTGTTGETKGVATSSIVKDDEDKGSKKADKK